MSAAKAAMACPTQEILTSFTLGEPFELPSAAEIATHIDTCPQCTTFVGGVVEKVVEWSVPEPTEAEAAALDEEIEVSWRDFWDRNREELE